MRAADLAVQVVVREREDLALRRHRLDQRHDARPDLRLRVGAPAHSTDIRDVHTDGISPPAAG